MATIRDVANRAQVSTATVSAVVNDSAYVSPELRARVLAAINELNYTPSLAARNLKRGRSQLLALVVADLANPFFARLVSTLCLRAPDDLEPAFQADYAAAASDPARLRVVVDQVASLTDASALAWHQRLTT